MWKTHSSDFNACNWLCWLDSIVVSENNYIYKFLLALLTDWYTQVMLSDYNYYFIISQKPEFFVVGWHPSVAFQRSFQPVSVAHPLHSYMLQYLRRFQNIIHALLNIYFVRTILLWWFFLPISNFIYNNTNALFWFYVHPSNLKFAFNLLDAKQNLRCKHTNLLMGHIMSSS
jgi:hypothetical protein